jgi:perosamine synthetase
MRNLKIIQKIKSIKKKDSKFPNKEIEYVLDVLDSDSKKKAYVYNLENKIAKLFKSKYAIACNSGTSALHACVAALNLKKTDEVIVPSLAVVMDAYAVIHCGAKPVFADVNKDSMLVTARTIKEKITKNTKAIILVSLQGLPIDIDPILKLAKKNNIKIIEDNAQEFYGKYKKRISGISGDMSIWSFENKKHLSGATEGGVITTNNSLYAKKIRKFCGIGYINLNSESNINPLPLSTIQNPDYLRFDYIGLNYRMPEIVGAVCLGQLENFKKIVARRVRVAKMFDAEIKKCNWLKPQRVTYSHMHTYYSYAVRYLGDEMFGIKWEQFYSDFTKMGGDGFYAGCYPIYKEPSLLNYFKEKKFKKVICKNAELVQKQIIQFKTNYRNMKNAKKNTQILSALIFKYNKLIK